MNNIRHNLMIEAASDVIYNAITLEQGLQGWWTIETTAKPEVGYVNHFRFGDQYFNKMEILKLVWAKEVHWKCVDGDKEWINTKLSFELEEKDNGVFLKFSHMDWDSESEFFGFCNHHWGRYLDSLKSLCETGKGNPFKQENS